MKFVVTGATSGLGRNLAERLCSTGHTVIGLGRRIDAGRELSRSGILFHQVELEDQESLIGIMRGAEVVFHCAALSSPWGKYEDFFAANVIGTENIISAMEHADIPMLVHVSTPSFYFNYSNRSNICEQDPLPAKFVNAYAETKKIAEEKVLRACEEGRVKATIIRPRAIIGPYDRNILPRLMSIAKKGFIPLINNGSALVDITYVENVVDAMLLTLEPGIHQSGKIYNITNGEPITLRELVVSTLEYLGMNIPLKNISYRLVGPVAACMEAVCKLLPLRPEPLLTRYSAGLLAFGQTLNIDAAKNDLRYIPRIPINEGIKRAAIWWKENAN